MTLVAEFEGAELICFKFCPQNHVVTLYYVDITLTDVTKLTNEKKNIQNSVPKSRVFLFSEVNTMQIKANE